MVTFQFPIGQPFRLVDTLKCGQGHRWIPDKDGAGWWTTVWGERLVRARQPGGHDSPLEVESAAERESAVNFLRWQFRFDDPVEDIYRELSDRDTALAGLIEQYRGLRVMRVDPWECLVFFILSANNNIPRIHRDMDRIAQLFGRPVSMNGGTRHTFPSTGDLLQGGDRALAKLDALRLGLDKHIKIFRAAESVHSGDLELDRLARETSCQQAIVGLRRLPGVGDKVANCIALFSLEKPDAFPVDTHISAALERHFPRANLPKTNEPKRKWAQGRFGRYAGFASQFLFVDQLRQSQ